MKLVIFLLYALISCSLNAKDLIRLYDTGNATLFNKNSDPNLHIKNVDPIKVLSSQFPIESKLWELSEFKSKKVNLREMRSPIFLVGCDDSSLSWINYRRSLLEQNRVLGFVINCPSYEDYNTFKAAIYPIVVQAANMDKLAEHLNHNLYPAYIHNQAIEQ